ncbi:MAG: hypothetical protein JSS32_09610, partial [Verrucomicrobia bacterium]|nr:hypothetical protein [Verrucomicrobiota bacterium]
TGPTTTAALYSLRANSSFNVSPGNTYSNVYGSSITPTIQASGTGSVGTIFGSYIQITSTAGTGSPTDNAFGLYIDTASVQNTTTAYGLYVNTPTGAGTNISGYFSTAPLFGTPLLVASGGTGRTVLTTYGVLLGEGSNGVNVTAAGSDGQILVGSSTGDPAFATVSSITGTLSFVVGHNSLSIDIKAPVPVPFGGTGRTVLTTSGVLLGEGSNNVNVTAAGTDGQVLIGSSTGDPAFSAITSSAGTLSFTVGHNLLNIEVVSISSLIAPLPVPSGGTGRTVLTTSGVLIGEGSNNINVTAAGTNGQVLIGSSAGDPAFATITSFTGTLTFIAHPNNLSIDLAAPVPIAFGGTNTTTFGNTTSSVLYFDGSRITSVGPGSTGQILTSNGSGTAPSFQSPSMQSATSLSLSGVITVTPPTSIALINTSFSITGPTTTAALYS